MIVEGRPIKYSMRRLIEKLNSIQLIGEHLLSSHQRQLVGNRDVLRGLDKRVLAPRVRYVVSHVGIKPRKTVKIFHSKDELSAPQL